MSVQFSTLKGQFNKAGCEKEKKLTYVYVPMYLTCLNTCVSLSTCYCVLAGLECCNNNRF